MFRDRRFLAALIAIDDAFRPCDATVRIARTALIFASRALHSADSVRVGASLTTWPIDATQHRIDEKEIDVSWPDLMRDLAHVRAVEVEADRKRYRPRTVLRGHAAAAFAAGGGLAAVDRHPPRERSATPG